MDRYIIISVLILFSSGQVVHSASKSCCCCVITTTISLISGGVGSLVRAWNSLTWITDLADYLDSQPQAQDLPCWLLEHPPPMEMKYQLIWKLLYYLISDDTITTLIHHRSLKSMLPCELTSREDFDTAQDFLLYVADNW